MTWTSLFSFLMIAQVTRVAREVGTEGRLGGQAQVKNVAGTWKDLTDNVNVMANNVCVDMLSRSWVFLFIDLLVD